MLLSSITSSFNLKLDAPWLRKATIDTVPMLYQWTSLPTLANAHWPQPTNLDCVCGSSSALQALVRPALTDFGVQGTSGGGIPAVNWIADISTRSRITDIQTQCFATLYPLSQVRTLVLQAGTVTKGETWLVFSRQLPNLRELEIAQSGAETFFRHTMKHPATFPMLTWLVFRGIAWNDRYRSQRKLHDRAGSLMVELMRFVEARAASGMRLHRLDMDFGKKNLGRRLAPSKFSASSRRRRRGAPGSRRHIGGVHGRRQRVGCIQSEPGFGAVTSTATSRGRRGSKTAHACMVNAAYGELGRGRGSLYT